MLNFFKKVQKNDAETTQAPVQSIPTTFCVGSPERLVTVSWNTSAQKLHDLFKNFRQPSVEVFQEALSILKGEKKNFVLIVNYSNKTSDNPNMEQISEHVFKNTLSKSEYWI